MVTFAAPKVSPAAGEIWYVRTHYLAGAAKVVKKTIFGRYEVVLLEIRGIKITLPKKAFVKRLPRWPHQPLTES